MWPWEGRVIVHITQSSRQIFPPRKKIRDLDKAILIKGLSSNCPTFSFLVDNLFVTVLFIYLRVLLYPLAVYFLLLVATSRVWLGLFMCVCVLMSSCADSTGTLDSVRTFYWISIYYIHYIYAVIHIYHVITIVISCKYITQRLRKTNMDNIKPLERNKTTTERKKW